MRIRRFLLDELVVISSPPKMLLEFDFLSSLLSFNNTVVFDINELLLLLLLISFVNDELSDDDINGNFPGVLSL